MKKSAFTMIELIFVIVILGILAAVAVPRLAGVQDDAIISTEKSGIGAIRSGIQAMNGKIMVRGAGVDFNTTVVKQNGDEETIEINSDAKSGSKLRFLSVNDDWNAATQESAYR
ncbi:MAG: type II secretion system protein [Campylobacterales bacterium]